MNSRPEGISLQQKTYTMSEDTNLFQPPPSYPEAPKNMYYQVPAIKPEPQKLTQIFPWENRAPQPTRVFADEQPAATVSSQDQVAAPQTSDSNLPPQTPPPRPLYEPSTDSWETYTRSNAWDEDPHIQRYIESIQQARRGKTQVISGSTQSPPSTDTTGHPPADRPSIRLTDFPTEVERPSLPVTPAPIQRRGNGNRDSQENEEGKDTSATTAFPAAEGVPSQEDWVGVTVDAFSHLLNATYLLWRSTESPGPARRAPSSAIRRPGGSGVLA